MRVLQGDEWDSAAPPVQKRFAVGEVRIAKMIRADGRIAAALHGIVEEHADQFFVLAKLPDEPAIALLQRLQSPFTKLFPTHRALTRQRWTDIRPSRRNDIARVAVSAETRHVHPGSVFLVRDEELHRDFLQIGEALCARQPPRFRILRSP
jgi:hypothetical protein